MGMVEEGAEVGPGLPEEGLAAEAHGRGCRLEDPVERGHEIAHAAHCGAGMPQAPL